MSYLRVDAAVSLDLKERVPMSFLTENSAHCWKGVTPRSRPLTIYGWRSCWDAPNFQSHTPTWEREKGMQSVTSASRSLTSIWPRPPKSLLKSPQRASKRSPRFRPIPVASPQVPVHKGSEGSNIGEMGGAVWRPLDQLLPVLQDVVPFLTPGRHKGQAGKIGVVGGSREYTGAPYYAAISALKMGADLAHVFCTEGAGVAIKSYSPELIVHPVLRESHNTSGGKTTRLNVVEKVVADVRNWIQRCDCLVIGPGLGRDELLLESVAEIIIIARENKTPMIIDGDGLFLVTSRPELVVGYPSAVLTPNVNEHKRLLAKMMGDDKMSLPDDCSAQLRLLAEKMSGVTIVQKGQQDLISDGRSVFRSDYFGSPRRCGGQGDVLSGSIAVFMAWSSQCVKGSGATKIAPDSISSNPGIIGGLAGSLLVRRAAAEAFEKHRRSTLTTDIIEALGPSMEALFPVQI